MVWYRSSYQVCYDVVEFTGPFDYLGFFSSIDNIFTCLWTLATYISHQFIHFIGEFSFFLHVWMLLCIWDCCYCSCTFKIVMFLSKFFFFFFRGSPVITIFLDHDGCFISLFSLQRILYSEISVDSQESCSFHLENIRDLQHKAFVNPFWKNAHHLLIVTLHVQSVEEEPWAPGLDCL